MPDQQGTNLDSIGSLELTRRQFTIRALAAGVGLPSILAFLEACAGGSSGPSTTGSPGTATGTMRIAVNFTITDPLSLFLLQFKDKVDKDTGGRLNIQLFPNGQLGTDLPAITGMQLGTVDAWLGPASSAEPLLPDLALMDLPYIFDSVQHYYKVVDGPIGKKFEQELEAKGVHVLDWWGGDPRDIYTTKRKISSPADLKGAKIRVLGSPIYVATFRAFGAAPTTIAVSELFLALQTGTADGGEGGLSTMIGSKFDQVCKYVALTHHGFPDSIFAVSSKWWGALAADLQQSVQKAAGEITQVQRQQTATAEPANVKLLQAERLEVVAVDQAQFRALAQPVWSQFPTIISQDAIDAVRKLATG